MIECNPVVFHESWKGEQSSGADLPPQLLLDRCQEVHAIFPDETLHQGALVLNIFPKRWQGLPLPQMLCNRKDPAMASSLL